MTLSPNSAFVSASKPSAASHFGFAFVSVEWLASFVLPFFQGLHFKVRLLQPRSPALLRLKAAAFFLCRVVRISLKHLLNAPVREKLRGNQGRKDGAAARTAGGVRRFFVQTTRTRRSGEDPICNHKSNKTPP